MGIYRYKLSEDYSRYCHQLAGVYHSSEWLTIHDGWLTIKAGYAWDGCSPTWRIGGVWLGTPDGRRVNGKPKSYYASLVHDALCQMRVGIQTNKQAVTELFVEMLREGGFAAPVATIYGKAVSWLGPQEWGQGEMSVITD